MKCPGCGIEIVNPGKFCGSCGTRLIQRLCPNGHIMNENDENCPHCATQNVPKVKTISPENKGKTLFEINTFIPTTKQEDEVKEFSPNSKSTQDISEVRKTRVVKTDVIGGGKVLSGWLVSFDRKAEGEDYKVFSTENIIGASPACDIVIDEDTVSSRHAVISYRDGNFYIKDLGSTNGTFLNGVRVINEVLLSDGDWIKFGAYKVVFVRFKRN